MKKVNLFGNKEGVEMPQNEVWAGHSHELYTKIKNKISAAAADKTLEPERKREHEKVDSEGLFARELWALRGKTEDFLDHVKNAVERAEKVNPMGSKQFNMDMMKLINSERAAIRKEYTNLFSKSVDPDSSKIIIDMWNDGANKFNRELERIDPSGELVELIGLKAMGDTPTQPQTLPPAPEPEQRPENVTKQEVIRSQDSTQVDQTPPPSSGGPTSYSAMSNGIAKTAGIGDSEVFMVTSGPKKGQRIEAADFTYFWMETSEELSPEEVELYFPGDTPNESMLRKL